MTPPSGKQRQHRRRGAGDLARVADHIGNHASGRGRKLALVQGPFRPRQFRFGAAQGGGGGSDFLRARGQLRHSKIGLDLCGLGFGGGKGGGGIFLLGLGRGTFAGEAADPRGIAPGLGRLGAGRDKHRLDHPDFLGPLAFAQIGKLAFGL